MLRCVFVFLFIIFNATLSCSASAMDEKASAVFCLLVVPPQRLDNKTAHDTSPSPLGALFNIVLIVRRWCCDSLKVVHVSAAPIIILSKCVGTMAAHGLAYYKGCFLCSVKVNTK